MDVHEIEAAGKGFEAYLEEFSDCFGRRDTASYLGIYVEGQHSDLQRKSAEPIALKAEIPPRSLQVFLRTARWDEERMVDRVQEIVARDHGHPFAMGMVDESASPKKGNHTAGVQRAQQSPRQYCGNTGKIDNCVVSVHIGYTAGSFHALLDSELFLPKAWADDPARRETAGIPDDVRHRTKPEIALAQIKRAEDSAESLGNGIRVSAWTFDEQYGRGLC